MADMATNELTIEQNAFDKMLKNVSKTYPSEGCGLLLGSVDDNRVSSVSVMNNLAGKKRAKSCFIADPLTVYEAECEAEKEGIQIMGFYHSHPDAPAVPSTQDKEHMIPGMMYLILSVWGRKLKGIRAFVRQEPDGNTIPVPVSIMEDQR